MSQHLKNKVVCHVTSVHPWDDIRIFKKEATSTAKYAKLTYLVAANSPDETINGVQVTNVIFPEKYSRLKRIFVLKKKVIDKAISLDADVYHLHDPELLSGVKKFKRKGKLVVYDSHEDLPKALLTKSWLKFNWVRKLVSSIYNSYEKNICKKCAGVISVLPEITDQFDNKNLETIYNYPLVSIDEQKSSNSDKFTLIYNGGLTEIRGIKEICEAMNYLDDSFRLKLLGKWESESFKNDCLNAVTDKSKIEYLGLVDYDTCQAELQRADLGLVMFRRVPNHEISLPNKSFEFVINQLPVLMSNIPYWEKEFDSFALFSDPLNPKGIAEKVNEIRNNYEHYLDKTSNYRKTVIAEKNWDVEEKKLIDFYEKILQ